MVNFQKLSETVAPIFDADRGRRLEIMRKALLLDQKQLGARLGVSQQMISKLERGITPVSRKPITLAQLYSVFGCTTDHILFNADKKDFNYEHINQKYWIEKDRRKGNRTARLPKKRRRRY